MEPKLLARLVILILSRLSERLPGFVGDDPISKEIKALAQTYAEATRLASIATPDLGAVPIHTTSRGKAALERAEAPATPEA